MEEVPGLEATLFLLDDEDALSDQDEEVLLHVLRVVLPVRLARLEDVDADSVLLETLRRLEVAPFAALGAPPPARVGEVDLAVAEPIKVARDDDGAIVVTRPDDERRNRSLHGLSRTLVANLVTGVTEGYTIKMEIFGVGYRVVAKGSNLEFALGYSHPVLITAPEGVTFAVETPTKFSITGIDKQKVGQIAANIRRLRKSDPYKGKGIRYEGEQIRRKVGKTGK